MHVYSRVLCVVVLPTVVSCSSLLLFMSYCGIVLCVVIDVCSVVTFFQFQSEIGFGKLQTYTKLEKLGEVSHL